MAGWNGSDMRGGSTPIKPKVTAKKPSPIRGIVAGLAVCVLAFGVWFIFFSDSEKQRTLLDEQNPRTIKNVGKSTPSKIKQIDAEKHDAKDSRAGSEQTPSDDVAPTSQVVKAAGNADESSVPKPVFDNPCDDLIAKLVMGCGDDIPPLPQLGPEYDKLFREALKKPIVIKDDDSEEVRALKERVTEWRKDVLELMDNGESFSSILNGHRDLLAENTRTRDDCRRELNKIIQGGDLDGAKQYLFKINLALQQMGIKEMDTPRALWTEEEVEAHRAKLYEQRFGEGRKKRLEQKQPHFK